MGGCKLIENMGEQVEHNLLEEGDYVKLCDGLKESLDLYRECCEGLQARYVNEQQ